MSTPQIDQPPRLLTRFDQAAAIATILRHAARHITTDPTLDLPFPMASPGELRGIPAIGRSVTGAINGTVPHHIH